MIAAQLLAYYFTELKDDQVKKVSPAVATLATALHSPHPLATACILPRPLPGSIWLDYRVQATGLVLGFTRALSSCEHAYALRSWAAS